MTRIDEIYTAYPFSGSRKITIALKQEGLPICRERVQKLMRQMAIEVIYPKPRLSMKDKQHTIYPYLLANYSIERPNQVWSSAITYIRLQQGFMYLVAIIDWYSRYVLSWRLSNASSVLRSKRAIQVNIQIMRVFTQLREMLSTHADLKRKIESMEKKYDAQFKIVFEAIKQLLKPPKPKQLLEPPKKSKKKIGFHSD